MYETSTTSSLGPDADFDTALSTIRTTSTITSTTTSWTTLHGVAPQKMRTTITSSLPNPADATFSAEWFTATGTRLAELNAAKVQAASMNMDSEVPTVPAESTTTLTTWNEVATSTMENPPEIVTTSQPAASSNDPQTEMLPTPSTNALPTSAAEPDDSDSFAVWDPATAEVASPTDAPSRSAITTITTTVPAASDPPFMNSTLSSPLSPSTASPAMVTAFSTVLGNTSTITSQTSGITTEYVTMTTTLSDEAPSAPSDKVSESPTSNVVTVTVSPSDTAVTSSGTPTSSDAQTSEIVVADAVSAAISSPTELVTLAASSRATVNTVMPVESTPSLEPASTSTDLQPRDIPEHHIIASPKSIPKPWIDDSGREPIPNLANLAKSMTTSTITLNPGHHPQGHQHQHQQHHQLYPHFSSRYNHLSSPLAISLALSVCLLLSLIFWHTLTTFLRRRRAARELALGLLVYDWNSPSKPPRPDLKKRTRTSQDFVPASPSPTHVSGQHAGKTDPRYWATGRRGIVRRGSMA
ncbi:hypothetical protein PMZ80_002214 [Knufia obscura]|uniref:Uncharacterized protein n=2 Tax=Knufia TaxID=430999 RepID=A0AAN8I128_9EURO|nr:hypothetical protein PMZ80_002214 [Knufia obscura]KAK5947882.1 hypothetical protein OHC33_011089 [Knufia fluminis]